MFLSMRRLIIKLIEDYQKSKGEDHIPSCLFTPSCSDYAKIALSKYNLLKAIYLIINRIYRCDVSKLHSGGIDIP